MQDNLNNTSNTKSALNIPLCCSSRVNPVNVDTLGRIFYKDTNQDLPTFVGEDGDLYVELDWIEGHKAYRVADAILASFVSPKIQRRRLLEFKAFHVNGNRSDNRLRNLRWGLRDKPVASDWIEGFYVIPGYSQYVINKEGTVMLHREYRIENGFNDSGYHSYRLRRDGTKSGIVGQHRLLMLAFIPTQSAPSALVVNHKDGNTSNNDLSNLEWTTAAGNAKHANDVLFDGEGIDSLKRSKPILARNVITGEIKDYPSLRTAAKVLGVNYATICWRLGTDQTVYDGWQYKFAEDDTPWREPSEEEKYPEKKVRIRYTGTECKAVNPETGEVKYFENRRKLADFLGLPRQTVEADLTGQNKHKLRNGWDISFTNPLESGYW